MEKISTGTLHVISTPIGNLNDLSNNMIDALKKADIIAAEDTRVSLKLLHISESKGYCLSLHKFNEKKKIDTLIEQLKKGKNVALISDAGSPGVSDPGFLLVNAAHEAGIPVHSVPGPSSVTVACSVSGFDCSRFLFLGFLPKKAGELTTLFQSIQLPLPLVIAFFEAPNRIDKTLSLFTEILPDNTQFCLCKEISKKYETILKGSLLSLVKQIKHIPLKGEWTCLFELKQLKLRQEYTEKTLEEVCDFFSINRSKASKILSIVSGKPRQDIYSGRFKE